MADETRSFVEDVVCDHCNMEIDGPGVTSGHAEGDDYSGWMHQDVSKCEYFIEEEGHLRMFEDGEYTPPDPPPNRRGEATDGG